MFKLRYLYASVGILLIISAVFFIDAKNVFSIKPMPIILFLMGILVIVIEIVTLIEIKKNKSI